MNNSKLKLIFALSLWLISVCLTAQSIERSVIATTGDASPTMSYTIGEPLVDPEANIFISAGFQQLSFPLATDVLSAVDITDRLSYFPNPSRRFVNIQGAVLNAQDTRVWVYNLEGLEIQLPTQVDQGIQLDFINQRDGVYFLVLEDLKQHHIAKFKLVITK